MSIESQPKKVVVGGGDGFVVFVDVVVVVGISIVVVVHVFDIVVVGPRNLSLKVGQNQVINRPDFFVGIVVVVDFVVLLLLLLVLKSYH